MTANLTHLSIDGCVATLTLKRPEQRNALSVELLDALHARLDEFEAHENVHVLVLTGAGRAFCAGMDLRQVVIDESSGGSGNEHLPPQLLKSLARLTIRLRRQPAVTIARINGAAIGGGCGLACVCDLAVTHADAKLGFPEVDLGLCPAVVAPWVVQKTGGGPARAILLAGGLMTGAEAHRRGLVDELAPDVDALDATAHALIDRIAKGGPHALAATKRLLNDLDGSLDEELIFRGAELSARVLAGDEAQAALAERIAK